MKITTVRFGTDLWRLLEAESALTGVSVAQYIREAALTRAAASTTAREEGHLGLLAGAVREVMGRVSDAKQQAEARRLLAALARLTASEATSASSALTAQSRQAARRSSELADQVSADVQRRARTGTVDDSAPADAQPDEP